MFLTNYDSGWLTSAFFVFGKLQNFLDYHGQGISTIKIPSAMFQEIKQYKKMNHHSPNFGKRILQLQRSQKILAPLLNECY